MAWMSDEKYEYIQDCKEKKSIGASAFKARTHCGKGGRVKLPSDFMSKKELNAMNGECKSYRLNDPMSWEEFKSLPDDLKVCYIKGLREKFGVPDTKLIEMWDVTPYMFNKWVKCLGLQQGKGAGAAGRHWYKTDDCVRFNAWWFGVKMESTETPSDEPVEAVEQENVGAPEVREEYVEAALAAIGEAAATVLGEMDNESKETVEYDYNLGIPNELIGKEVDTYPNGFTIPSAGPIECVDKSFAKYAEHVDRYAQSIGYECKKDDTEGHNPGPIAFSGHHMPVIPKNGTMTFENNHANDALDTIKCLLSDARVNLTISWECVFEDGVVCER